MKAFQMSTSMVMVVVVVVETKDEEEGFSDVELKRES